MAAQQRSASSSNSSSNNASSSASSSSNNSKEFFDLHTRGIGYLNRTRIVNAKGKGGRRGDSFLACSINALHGDANDPNTSLFDCRVSGTDAQEIVQALMPEVDANRRVLIAFCIGDIYAHTYERKAKEQGADHRWHETGEMETAALIKGRLLQITHVKVDGEVVYERDQDGVIHTSLQLGQAPAQADAPQARGSARQQRTGTHG